MNENKSSLFAIIPNDKIEIPILTPEGDDVGVSFEFEPMDARTDAGFIHILQRGTRQKQPTTDEGIRYVFKHKFAAIKGITVEDVRGYGCTDEQVALFERSPKDFFLGVAEVWRLVRIAVNAYLDRTLPDPGESKSRS
ncbi:MAG: hypothetical protein AB1631_33100 [Acidobacteriota bacterium]